MTFDSLLSSIKQKYPNIDPNLLEGVVGCVYDQLYDAAFDDGYDVGVAESKKYHGSTIPNDDDVDRYDIVKASTNEDAYDSVKASENGNGYDVVEPKDENDGFIRDPVDGHILSGKEWFKYMLEHNGESGV